MACEIFQRFRAVFFERKQLLLETANRFLIAKYNDLSCIFHRTKSAPPQFFTKEIHTSISLDIAHLSADYFAPLDGFASEYITQPDIGR